jgi:hypothetical protein
MNSNLDPKTIRAVTRYVYQKFPELAGVQPKVRLRQPSQAKSNPGYTTNDPTYLFTYQNKAPLPGGHSLERWVRVVVNAAGKILKVTTSR